MRLPYDATGQLISADHDYQTDEAYVFDLNGNRQNPGYEVGRYNRLKTDGTYYYEYDPEGNRTERYVWTDGDADGQIDENEKSSITEYTWDYRNRLVSVVDRDTSGGDATHAVDQVFCLSWTLSFESVLEFSTTLPETFDVEAQVFYA